MSRFSVTWPGVLSSVLLAFNLLGQDAIPAGPFSVQQIVPAPGETIRDLISIEVQFDRKVVGVDLADLLVNDQPAIGVNEPVEGDFVFRFATQGNGPANVRWKVDHGITDLAGNSFVPEDWSYIIDTNSSPVMISEFMAVNDHGIRDGDGERSDWIELYNPSEDEVDLTGWFLTTSQTNLTQWQFPETSIAPRGFKLLFASQKNRTNGTELHTNFKLSGDGEFLALVSPSTNIVSAFSPGYPTQFPDVSYGRAIDSPRTVGYFTNATPGTLNSTRGAGFAPDVVFSRTGGPITEPFVLTLSATPMPNLVIRYTTNGTLPTATSMVYRTSIPVNGSLEVRARAFVSGLLPGAPRTESYAFLSNLGGFTSILPVVIVQSIGKSPSSTAQTPTQLTFFEPVNGVTRLTNPPTLTTRSGIQIRGSSTEGIAKSSWGVEFWDEFDRPMDHAPLGMPEESDFVLYAPNNFEPIMIHNPFIHRLSREMGMYSSRTRFVEVFLQKVSGNITSNSYYGIYVLEEKIKVGKNRVAIDKLRASDKIPPDVTGGYLLKVDRPGPGETGYSGAGTTVIYVDPKEREIKLTERIPQGNYIRTYLSNFNRALSSASWRNPVSGYPAYIDIDSWIDFHVIEVFSGNVDSLVLSTYFHKPRGGKLTFGPHWDYDRALGSTDGRDSNPRNWSTGPFFTAPWWSRLLSDVDFWQRWIDRWQDLRENILSREHINGTIDDLTNELREAQPRETRKWRTAFRGGTYNSEIDWMKNWLSNRVDYIDGQITQRPKFLRAPGKVEVGSTVELTVPAGATVYYTVNGSDPRLSQGGVSAAAQIYSGPIPINENTRIFARAWDSKKQQTRGPRATTPWSGPAIGTFYVEAPKLLVSEIMFHPADPAIGSTNLATDFEFIELLNAGTKMIELGGIQFTSGLTFTFSASGPITRLQPGERAVLVKNRSAFLSRYPEVTNIAGEFTGSLSSSGERIALAGALGEPILDFSYKDTWHRATDGTGFSLVLANETIAAEQLGTGAIWKASALPGGSPGAPEPSHVMSPRVVVNEVLANPAGKDTDAIELYNESTETVDISGWYLTDKISEPQTYRIPDGTTIAPGGYLVLRENAFNGPNGGFGLSASGEEVYLFAADLDGNLTGYAHGFSFGPTETGVSLGRYETSDGQEYLLPESAATFGTANAPARFGPVIISELMFDTYGDAVQQQFIELKNVTDAPVALYDLNEPTRTWRIRGGVDIDLPPGIVIPGRGFVTIVGFNPANAYYDAPFRSRYGMSASARLIGPWSGRLSSTSEEVELQRPARISNSLSDYVLADSIAYNRANWRQDGSGRSIQRRSGIGEEPRNWVRGIPNPGDLDSDGDGLPDAWEEAHGLNKNSPPGEGDFDGDPDNDGFSNYQEFVSGTSPQVADGYLELDFSVTPSKEVQLGFVPVAGRSYSVYYTTDPAGDHWELLRSYPVVNSAAPIVIRDKASLKARFYRLQIP